MRHAGRTVAATRFASSTRRDLLLEILALRHQLGVLARSNRRFARLTVAVADPATTVAAVERRARPGPAGYSRPLALRSVSSLLAMALATSRTATHRFTMSRPDSALGRRKPSLGCAADPWRTLEAGNRRLRTHRVALFGRSTASAVTDVAYIPRESAWSVHADFAGDATVRAIR